MTKSHQTSLLIERIEELWRAGKRKAALRIARAEAEGGDREIQHLLATLLGGDDTRDEDRLTEAIHWYDSAADQGLADDYWRAAALEWRTLRVGDTVDLPARYRQAARAGSRTGSRNLITLIGSDVVHGGLDEPGFLGYLQDHAEDGFDEAQFLLGKCYDCGFLGVPPDHQIAFQWYLRAARQGHAQAQCYVGIFHALGIAVDRDGDEAVAWYQRAASQGNAKAMCNLGYSYEVGRSPLTASMEEANCWYQRSAAAGDPQGQHNLAMSYRLGRGLPQDLALAARWYAHAAEQGNEFALYELGRCCELGEGVDQDDAMAARLYRMSAVQGYAPAQNRLAYMYAEGRGVPRDERQAYFWVLLACAAGQSDAAEYLKYAEGRLSEAERTLAQTEARNWKSVPYTGVTPGETPSWTIVDIG